MHIARPIIKRTETKNIIPNRSLNVSLIWSNKETIFLSAIGSQIADAKLYITVSTVNFIIGIAQIPSMTIIPTNPIEFFKSDVAFPFVWGRPQVAYELHPYCFCFLKIIIY